MEPEKKYVSETRSIGSLYAASPNLHFVRLFPSRSLKLFLEFHCNFSNLFLLFFFSWR